MTNGRMQVSIQMADQTHQLNAQEPIQLANDFAATYSLPLNYNAEQRLPDQESKLLEMLGSIPAAVYTCNTEGKIVYYNRQAAALSGYGSHLNPAPARDGYKIDLCVPPAAVLLKTVLATGDAIVNRELVSEQPDAPCTLLASIAPLRDANGTVTGAISVLQDISELRKAQQEREQLLEELKRSNEELARFSYTVSHDLLGPVSQRPRFDPTAYQMQRGRSGESLASCIADRAGLRKYDALD